MVSGPIRFGETGSGKVYDFTAGITQYRTNFGEVVPRTSRLPGVDGGVDHDGEDAAKAAIGNVTFGFTLRSTTRAGMDDLRDAVMEMQWWGRQRLFYQPTEGSDAERFVWAKVNNISMAQRKDQHTDYWQKVTISFQAADPHFFDPVNDTWIIGSAHEVGEVGLEVGGDAIEIAASGLSTDRVEVHNGNSVAIARIAIQVGAGQTCENPIIRRIVGSIAEDEVGYVGTLVPGDILTFDGRKADAILNGVAVWDDVFYDDIQFLRLNPGSNTLRILFNNIGDAASIFLFYSDTYRQ